MAFTTEALQELGLTEGQVKDVFALHGKDLNAVKTDLETVTQERDSLKKQVQTVEEQLNTLKEDANTNKEQQEALGKLQEEFDKYKAQAAEDLAYANKVSSIKLALKDTNAYSSDALMRFIDIDSIEMGEDGKPMLYATLNNLRESDPYLFKAEETPSEPQPTPSIVATGNPTVTSEGESDPFQAIIDGYK